MRRFAIVFDEFSIERQSVKAGKNSEEAVTACRCINVGLFVSGNLRRDVIVSIIVLDNNTQATIVTFNGSTLRRVSPDERSISFFLLKAFDAAENLEEGQQRVLDNGVVVERTSLESLLELWASAPIYAASHEVDDWPASRIVYERGVFLYAPKKHLEIDNLLPSFSSPERFILEINLHSDRAMESA